MHPAIIALVVIALSSLPIMLTLFLYSNFYRVAVGETRKQIEINRELIDKLIYEKETGWSALMSHTPYVDKTQYEVHTCKQGCCKYLLPKK
jgi:hypothetical protein